MSGTFWTIEQVEPIIKERNELRQLLKEFRMEVCDWFDETGEPL